jgi:hypothetical protein
MIFTKASVVTVRIYFEINFSASQIGTSNVTFFKMSNLSQMRISPLSSEIFCGWYCEKKTYFYNVARLVRDGIYIHDQ